MKEVIMPKFGFNQEEAEIVRWLIRPGEKVDKGQPIAEVTTDKVNMEVEAVDDGIIDGLRYQEGDIVPVTEVIAYILASGEKLSDFQGAEKEDKLSPVEKPAREGYDRQAETTKKRLTPLAARIVQREGINPNLISGSGLRGMVTRGDVDEFLGRGPAGKVRAAPAARRLSKELGVSLEEITGSGPHGRVQSEDVRLAAQREVAPAPPKAESYQTPVREIIPLVGMRRTIAERMQKSAQEAPHIQFDIQIDATGVEGLREQANAYSEAGQGRVSLTAVIAKATGWALERHPLLNAWLLHGTKGQEIVVLDQVNLGIAVALEIGLIVPVVRDVNHKGLRQLSVEMNDVVERARGNRLSLDEVAEGTFTLSNLGMFGIDRFTAIINPPQVAILAVSRTAQQFVPDEQGNPILRPVMTLTLSADHRAVDGAVAARFMADLRQVLTHPEIMVL